MSHEICSEIQSWLEWSGSKLLSIQISSPKPKEYRSFWPDYKPDPNVAYGYTKERLRPAIPASKEIQLMDELLCLPGLIKDITNRRIVNARSLVTPVSNRYVYSWTKIAFMLHTDRKRVVKLHHSGLCEIAKVLPREKIDAIRKTLSSFS